MNHSPAMLLQALIIGQDSPLFTDPANGQAWPLYISSMPDGEGVPINCGAVYDTPGQTAGRVSGGKTSFQYGIQIKVRASSYASGYAKAEAVANLLDEIHNEQVEMGSTNSYVVDTLIQQGTIQALGVDGTERNELFTVNFLMMVRPL